MHYSGKRCSGYINYLYNVNGRWKTTDDWTVLEESANLINLNFSLILVGPLLIEADLYVESFANIAEANMVRWSNK